VAAWTRAGARRDAARATLGLGAAYAQLGLLRQSLQSYQAALPLVDESSDRVLASEVRSAVGAASALVADRDDAFDAAREHCRRAAVLARQAGSGAARAKAFGCLADVSYYHFRPEEALAFYEDAAREWDQLGDARGQAQVALWQGDVYSDLSRFEQARACYDRAQSLWARLGDERQQAITLVAEARLLLRRGHYQQSLSRFEGALALLQSMGDVVWEGSALTGVARAHLDLGDTRSALKHWERALQMFEEAGLKQIAADVLMSLGATYLASGDDEGALRRFERALALADELGIERWRAIALRYIGVVHLFRQQPHEARRYLESSLAAQRSVRHRRLEGETRADLGEVRLLLRRPGEAVRYFGDAIAVSRAAGDRVTQGRGHFGLARTSALLGDLAGARTHVEAAVSVADSLRTATENRDLRASYLAAVYRYHEFHMDVLMRLHRGGAGRGFASAAFDASERARARSLLDGLLEAGVNIRSGVDPELLRREAVLKRAFDDWSERRTRLVAEASGSDAKALADEYADLERRYGQLQAEIRGASPRHAALAQPRPLTLAEVQREVLSPDTLLLEYALGEERSYLWAVSDRDYSSHELPGRARIEAAARRTHQLLTARLSATGTERARRFAAAEADAEYWTEASRLSEMLLAPVANKIAGRRLLVVSDGALQYLPFAALPVPGARRPQVPLAVDHEIVSLPSASVLAVLRRDARVRAPAANVVAVLADPVFEPDDPRLNATTKLRNRRAARTAGGAGPPAGPTADLAKFPRLVATRQEADSILSMAPAGATLLASGFNASRAQVIRGSLGQYRFVHFATHGVFDADSPGSSGIVLSMFDERGRPQDGFLRLHDIYRLDLPVEAVVLSACSSALGNHVRGEGLVGLVRGFMHAGARRVVASLWKVDDEATGELMRVFYREMLEGGRTPAAALRHAQLTLRAERRWREPFYWAAFVLQGEPD
jgi:CHAT domain-containing protein